MTKDSAQYHNIKMTAILTQVVTFFLKIKESQKRKKQCRDDNINLYKNDYIQYVLVAKFWLRLFATTLKFFQRYDPILNDTDTAIQSNFQRDIPVNE